MRTLRGILDRITLRRLTGGLSEGDARAFRTTGFLQFLAFLLPTSLMPNVYFIEPPETHAYSFTHYFLLVIPVAIARFLLHKKKATAAATITLMALNYHIAALCIAFADDPAPLVFLILCIMPFIMIPAREQAIRWFLSLLAIALFLGDQYYYRVLGKPGIFGPAKWVVAGDYLMPPLIVLTSFLVIAIYQFVKAVDNAEAKLSEQYAKSEELLLNILPAEVAKELKQEGISKPRHFDSATVCFTDFQGFTQIAETLNPAELVLELDRCFSYFDRLMERYNLEKLKTIGDSYMFAGGVPKKNATHAVDSVMAALEIQAFMNQMKEIKSAQGLPYWQLRLGIHSGPLVAGVIGEKKFAYDIWSDTVNTASRCESSGVAGRINISGATYELVKNFFHCEHRGAVPAKHKGTIEMYFVHGILPALHRPDEPRVPNDEFEKRYRALAGN